MLQEDLSSMDLKQVRELHVHLDKARDHMAMSCEMNVLSPNKIRQLRGMMSTLDDWMDEIYAQEKKLRHQQ